MSYITKRFFDIVFAVFLLVVLAPVLVVVALAIKLNLGGPVIFRQQRPGLYGRPFYMYKFRTMTDSRGAGGELLDDARRMTSLGRFLRSASLDELPELWNVIKGDMSLVGPRPLLMEYLSLYDEEQLRRHNMRPGITGWAQVNGRNAISWEKKFRLDVWYVDNWTIILDLKVLLLTIKNVLFRDGISAEGHVTTERFRGNDR